MAAIAFFGAVIAVATVLPAPAYRWQEEQKARTEIREFLAEERRIAERWRTILDPGDADGVSFEALAARIESGVTSEYRESFEQLSALNLDPAAPSVNTLEVLKRYARMRGDASHALAEALLQNDPQRMREAFEALRRAPYAARGEAPAPAYRVDPPKPPLNGAVESRQ